MHQHADGNEVKTAVTQNLKPCEKAKEIFVFIRVIYVTDILCRLGFSYSSLFNSRLPRILILAIVLRGFSVVQVDDICSVPYLIVLP